MGIKLYGTPPSPPSHSARLMLEHKGLDHKMVWLLPGLWPALLRTRGFRGGTVPAMKIDGRRLQSSRAISRALEELQPDPPLFPADPTRRLEVEEAERWGDEVFQDTPRFLIRWLAMNRPEMRVHMATEAGVPAPRLLGPANAPIARYFARKVGADDAGRVEAIVTGLPAQLDRVDRLIADGVIGGPEPNAADFQIAATLRVLMNYEDLAPAFEGRPAAALATRLLPEYPTMVPAGFVPPEWL
jgi:glutathione S-transferase